MHFFSLFGLQPAFAINMADLEQRYIDLQSANHPDRFATQGANALQSATERSSEINSAYQILRSPFERARLLIKMQGVADPLAAHSSLPPDFLLEHMEQCEAFEDAKMIRDREVLQRLRQVWQDEADALWQRLERALDSTRDPEEAALCLRQLKFLMTQLDHVDEALFEWSFE